VKTINDDVRAYVPGEYLQYFDNNSSTTNPSVYSMNDYLTWSASSECGISCRNVLKATVYYAGMIDPAHHLNLWKLCSDQLLTICNS